MRIAIPVALLMMFATASLAQDEVVFAEATQTRIGGPHALRQRCHVHRPVNGCTEFVERQLACRCVIDGSRWRIAGRARVQPRLYFVDPYFEAHERLHLIDLSIHVERHLHRLGRARYDALESCRAAAVRAESQFSHRFDALIRESNRQLH